MCVLLAKMKVYIKHISLHEYSLIWQNNSSRQRCMSNNGIAATPAVDVVRCMCFRRSQPHPHLAPCFRN